MVLARFVEQNLMLSSSFRCDQINDWQRYDLGHTLSCYLSRTNPPQAPGIFIYFFAKVCSLMGYAIVNKRYLTDSFWWVFNFKLGCFCYDWHWIKAGLSTIWSCLTRALGLTKFTNVIVWHYCQILYSLLLMNNV